MGLAGLLSLMFLIGAIACYQYMVIAEKVYNANKSLANGAKYRCKDATIQELALGDGIENTCYSVVADFEIKQNTCADTVLKESVCGRCMHVNQNIQQWQDYEIQVCARSGKNVQARTFDSYDIEHGKLNKEDQEEYYDLARNQNCKTETRYGWRDHEHSFVPWDFPSSDPQDRGNRQFKTPGDKLRFQDPASSDPAHSIAFNNDGNKYAENKFKIAYDYAIGKSSSDPIHVWNATSFYGDFIKDLARDTQKLCIENGEASELNGGLTNSEFMALPDYGKETHYPLCGQDTGDSKDNQNRNVGTYKISADCVGKPESHMRVIGTATKDSNNQWQMGPYTSPESPDIENIPVMMFIWETDGSLSTSAAIDKYLQELALLFTSIKGILQACMGFNIIMMCVCGKIDKGKSSSSK